ncbi:hypothetical protein EMCRGX_G018035 [Ephydatia muelleri]
MLHGRASLPQAKVALRRGLTNKASLPQAKVPLKKGWIELNMNEKMVKMKNKGAEKVTCDDVKEELRPALRMRKLIDSVKKRFGADSFDMKILKRKCNQKCRDTNRNYFK